MLTSLLTSVFEGGQIAALYLAQFAAVDIGISCHASSLSSKDADTGSSGVGPGHVVISCDNIVDILGSGIATVLFALDQEENAVLMEATSNCPVEMPKKPIVRLATAKTSINLLSWRDVSRLVVAAAMS